MSLKFLMLTSDPDIARFVTANGVDRLFVDLERMGKAARQGHLDTWMSPHEPEDISVLASALPDADLLVRLNPLHAGSGDEIDDAIARGARRLMQPMWHSLEDVARFCDLVAGRVPLMPLAETAGAVAALPALSGAGICDEVLIGLNDLHLDLRLDFMFEPLLRPDLAEATSALRAAAMPFGIGGIARAGEGLLPPEVLLGEHVRHGSEWVILSRTFHRGASSVAGIEAEMDFGAEVARLRAIYDAFGAMGPEAHMQEQRAAADLIRRIAAERREARAAQP